MTNNITELTIEEKIKSDLLLNELSLRRLNDTINKIEAKLNKSNTSKFSQRTERLLSLEVRSDFIANKLIEVTSRLEQLESYI